MRDIYFLLPAFVQVGLTFALSFRMAALRVGALRSGAVKISDIALGQSNWPDPVQQVSRAFHNQLETPILFYFWVCLCLIAHLSDAAMLTLAWIYVLLRLAHAGVHVTSNQVVRRFQVFIAGFSLLALMWLILALRLAQI